MKQTDYQTITAMLENKATLEKALNDKEHGAKVLSEKVERLTQKYRDGESAVQGLRAATQNGSGHFQGQLNGELEKIACIHDDLTRTKGELADTQQQITNLKAQLSACNEKVGIHNLLAHQQTIAETKGELDKFQQLVDGQRQAIEAAGVHKDGLPPLIERRGELLADMALGEDKAVELAELDSRIAGLGEEQDNAQALGKQAVSKAQHTIAGLKPRMAKIQRNLAHLENLTPKMLDLFFMEKAEQAAHEFNALADKLVKKTMELRALKEILQDLNQRGKVDFFADQCSMLTIPCIEGAIPLEHLRGAKGTYANTHWEHVPYAETVSQIKQGLADQGVYMMVFPAKTQQ